MLLRVLKIVRCREYVLDRLLRRTCVLCRGLLRWRGCGLLRLGGLILRGSELSGRKEREHCCRRLRRTALLTCFVGYVVLFDEGFSDLDFGGSV